MKRKEVNLKSSIKLDPIVEPRLSIIPALREPGAGEQGGEPAASSVKIKVQRKLGLRVRHNDAQTVECESAPTRASVKSVSWSKQGLDTSLHTVSKPATQ